MQRRLASFTLILGISCLLCACGFQLRGTGGGGAALPEAWKKMHLITGNPNGEFSRAVRRVFTTDGIQWSDKADANYLLLLGPERFSQSNLSLNAEARVSQLELTMQTTFSVVDTSGSKVISDASAVVVQQMENDPRNAMGKARSFAFTETRCAPNWPGRSCGVSASSPPATPNAYLPRAVSCSTETTTAAGIPGQW